MGSGFGNQDPDLLGEAFRASDQAEGAIKYDREQEEARRAAAEAADELSKAQQALGKRARGQAYHGHPITSFFEFVLILLALLGVAIAALIWQTFFGDDTPAVDETPGHHHDDGSEQPGLDFGLGVRVVLPADRA